MKLSSKLKGHLHRSRLSSNAVTLLVWLLLSAPRGTVKVSQKDLMRALGWSYSMVRRTLEELTSKKYVAVTPAANQHKDTVIKILKFGADGDDSAVLTCEHPKEHFAVFTGEQNEPQDSEHGGALTDEQSADDSAVLKGEQGNAHSAGLKGEQSKLSICRETQEQVCERIANAIREGGHLAGELDERDRRAIGYLQFACERKYLSAGFVLMAVTLYESCEGNLPQPGIIASRIMNECLTEQRELLAQGKPAAKFCWPPGFQSHRDMLRKREKAARREEHAAAVA